MKLNQAIEKLIENPKDVYEVICEDGFRKELSVKDGYFIFKRYNSKGELLDRQLSSGGFNDNIKVADDWQKVRQPIPWQEAIQSWMDGKNVVVEVPDGTGKFCVSFLSQNSTVVLSKNVLATGKWYVK
ncbi:MAG TPA: hypothetical protein VMW10_05090 [Alphaproteobacteria bacterium]|nr:hypothetical protein [Alphaproteobacteria bacterium]